MSLNVEITADVAKAGQQIDQFAKSSRIALTNLSLVVQDLPFGFIGIQNNLPFVIKSFQDLSKETGGAGNALKSLGSSLIGPGGLFFAFSILTTGLTYLTQEYGSLSNAANILLGIQKSQKQILEDYNKELDKLISNSSVEIANLESLAGILKSTNSSQNQRVGAYNQLNKTFPDLLKGLEREKVLTGDLNGEIQKRIALISTQIRLEGQRNAIIKLLDESTTNYVKALRNAGNQDFLTGLGSTLRGLLSGDLNPFTQRITGLTIGIGAANKETQYWKTELDKINLSLTDVNGQISKFTVNTDNQSKKLKSNNKDLQEYQETYKSLIQLFKPAKQFVVPNVGGPMPNTFTFLPDEQDLKFYQEILAQFESSIQKVNDKIYKSLNRGLAEPIESLLNTLLTTGKFAWEEFGKTVLGVLKRITAQLLASGLATLIANLIAPGAGFAAGQALKGFSTGALGDFLGLGGAANFGGLSGGGMALSGSVVMVQRGSDLVGVLNRTNANIGRIG